MYCSIPRMLKGIRLAEEANSRRGIPVTAPDSKIRITVAVSLVKFSEALPRSRTKATARSEGRKFQPLTLGVGWLELLSLSIRRAQMILLMLEIPKGTH